MRNLIDMLNDVIKRFPREEYMYSGSLFNHVILDLNIFLAYKEMYLLILRIICDHYIHLFNCKFIEYC